MKLFPPLRNSMEMRVAPASIAFSSNSLMTDMGRSTTSPAAIWLATLSGSMRISGIEKFLAKS